MNRPATRSPLCLLLILWIGFAAYVWLTAEHLPQRVATHFGADGRANGWMTRAEHVRFVLLMGLVVPAFVIALFETIRRRAGWGLNIPHKEYWLAPERREETFAFIQRQGFWLAGLFIGLFAAIQYSIVAANAHAPARLTPTDAGWIGGLFIAAMTIWIICFLGRFFRKTR